MDNVTQITTHVDDGGKRLLGQFWGTQVESYDDVLFGQYQELEDVIFAMIQAKYLSFATGYTLSQIGALVGFPRPTGVENDDTYRALVYGRIAANVSYGTKQDIYDILGAFGATNRRVYNHYPRSIHVDFITSDVIADCDCVLNILNDATHPIEINITAHDADYFGFDDDPDALGFDEGIIGEGA